MLAQQAEKGPFILVTFAWPHQSLPWIVEYPRDPLPIPIASVGPMLEAIELTEREAWQLLKKCMIAEEVEAVTRWMDDGGAGDDFYA